jgi:hypothetical protein
MKKNIKRKFFYGEESHNCLLGACLLLKLKKKKKLPYNKSYKLKNK